MSTNDPVHEANEAMASRDDRTAVPSDLEFPVVGIGASAGGLPALLTLFEHMPSDLGMAFVVILHLSPRHESNADSVLGRVTTMPVLQVTEAARIEKDHIYVISPSRQLKMEDGHLVVSQLERPKGWRHAAIDVFFRTLADVHQERSICIVLSGTGSDGTMGVRHAKEMGGVTFAQSPGDAEFDGMPLSAIASGAVDFVLPVMDMPEKLRELWENARRMQLPLVAGAAMQVDPPPTVSDAVLADEALGEVMTMLRTRTGHDFRHYKRATVLRRLERRMQVVGVPTLPAYRSYLEANPSETRALLQDMLISVTRFFRDREAFEALDHLLHELPPTGQADRHKVRVWVAGCASGEEAYSVAMLLAERRSTARHTADFQVFATDIDERAIALGRAGVYPSSIVADVPADRLRQFFTKDNGQFRVRKELREKLLFAHHNVLRDPPFSNLDLVCCRNLLIYLDREIQAQVLEIFHYALKPGGLLLLGSSESADSAGAQFTVVDKKNRIYRSSGSGRRRMPSLPSVATGTLPALPALVTEPPNKIDELHRRVSDELMPASVLIDGASNLLHVSERAAQYFRVPAGGPSRQLLAVVLPALRLELRTAVFQAWELRETVEAQRVRLEREGRWVWVTMTARPSRNGQQQVMLVTFDEVTSSLGQLPGADEQMRDPMLVLLEEELERAREQLHGTIGMSAHSHEELKASNEELQAINEELRSATEELDTSKEELQSVNEELITVNQELTVKVEETSKINDDLQNLIAATDIATVFVDPLLNIKRFTPRASDLFNLIEADVGRSLLDITNRLDYPGLADDATKAFETLRVIEREVLAEDGRCFLVRALPYRTRGDVIDGAVLNFIDISATRRAEERMREGEATLAAVVDSTRDFAIITFDDAGMIATWNPGAERLFGYREAEMRGKPSDVIFTPEDRAARAPQTEMDRARHDGRAIDERWHVRKDGTRLFCSGVMTPLLREGQLIGYSKIARDITDQKHTESQLQGLLAAETAERTELQEAAALKDEFLAVMSHELKHPLNLILVNAELLSRLPEVRSAPAVATAADVIRRTVLGQAKIIDDLLDLSRVHTGKLVIQPAPVSLPTVVMRVVDAVTLDAQTLGLTLRTEFDDESFTVFADPTRVEQMVWNLVSNALKFTPAGGAVTLRLRRDGLMARLDVADTGRGLDAASVERVFDMFWQANRSTTRAQGGMGIGLALVKLLGEQQGGRVAVQSDGANRGCTFSIWLPLHGGAAISPPAARPVAALEGARLLVVDDTPDTLSSLSMLLELEGATVTPASSGEDALRAAAEADFDLLLSDIAMPGMDGYELIGKLRRIERNAHVAAIAVTGFGRAVDERRAKDAGFDAHLSKPIALSALLATWQQLKQQRRSGGAEAQAGGSAGD